VSAAVIAAIDYHLPARLVTNADLAREFPEWGAEKIAEKTGIQERHIAAVDECSSDLAAAAARKLFDRDVARPEEVDFILFCTQTPDFGLPTSACLLQSRLGLPTSAGALDFNLGCSGYVYGLALAKALIESGQANRLLLLTGETYSKLIDPQDKTVRTIFGDAGAATLVVKDAAAGTGKYIGPIASGTDGSGGPNLVCHRGGWRGQNREAVGREALWMNGPEIFNFTLKVVPEVITRALSQAGLGLGDIDLFVFHQANRYMLDHLRKKLGVPQEKFVIAIAHCGNTVSCTIPIALREAEMDGKLFAGARVLLVGFGVGYSWGATVIRWR
jgi:3-oxoacyl-[acyl-carrier-protein] synthase-3